MIQNTPKNNGAGVARGSTFQFVLSCAFLFGLFALYVGAVRLTTFDDDSVNFQYIGHKNVIGIFDVHPSGTLNYNYRPMSYLPWLLIRDWFGWFRPDMLHMINVWVHVLATALVVALAKQIGRRSGLRGAVFPFLAGLFFGLFPFTYQAVLWAAALSHPLMTVFGLGGVIAYMAAYDQRNSRRWLLLCSALLLLAACLSHEQGFTFGLFIPALDMLLPHRPDHRRLRLVGIALAMLMVGYVVFYKLVLQTSWSNPQKQPGGVDLPSILQNMAYQAQGMLVWLLLPLRTVIGLQQFPIPLPLMLLAPAVASILALLAWQRHLVLGLYCLGWWVLSISLTVFFLNNAYVLDSPRLMYTGSVGVALLYSAVLVLLMRLLGWRVITLALLVGTALLCLWCVHYILDWMSELERFTSAVKSIDTDLRDTDPSAKVLLVNMPWGTTPAFPTFPTGVEWINLFALGPVPPSTMVASINNTVRDTTYVFHTPSFKLGSTFNYTIVGVKTDDAGLRAAILQANYIYRFDYTPPGIRARRVAIIEPALVPHSTLVRFQRNNAMATVSDASVFACPDKLVMDLTWTGVNGLQEPVGVFVHGLDAQHQQVLVADRDPVDGVFPLNDMPAKVSIRERHEIHVPAGIDLAYLQVGVYSRADGQRYQAADTTGALFADNALTLPVVFGAISRGNIASCGAGSNAQ